MTTEQSVAYQTLVTYLQKLAKRRCWQDDSGPDGPDVYRCSGGNVDDAYEGGYEDGCAMVARDILKELENIFPLAPPPNPSVIGVE